MSQLVSTLRNLLEEADAQLIARRPQKARAGFEALLEQAQERADRPMAVIARAMLARLAIHRQALPEADELLDQATAWLDTDHFESHGRLLGTRVRLQIARGEPERMASLRDYFGWAEEREQWEESLDAAHLLAEHEEDLRDAVQWLERGVDIARLHGIHAGLGALFTHLASLHERLGNGREALRAHESALGTHEKFGSTRDQVGAGWAVGASAVAVEDWPLAQQRLEQALARAEGESTAQSFVPVVLAELATVYAASGDVIEARRSMERALDTARQQDLPTWWPERWAAMVRQADALDASV